MGRASGQGGDMHAQLSHKQLTLRWWLLLAVLLSLHAHLYWTAIAQGTCVTAKLVDSVAPQRALAATHMPPPTEACKDGRLFLGSCVPRPTPSAASCDTGTTWDASSDFCLFFTAHAGIVAITEGRWKQAQSVEASVWDGNSGGEDRNEQHARWFDHYNALRPHAQRLGRVLEIGSGPFTQTKTVLGKLGIAGVQVSSITLADPLMIFYHKQVPSCPYKDGSLLGFPTQFLATGAEELLLSSMYDTVIMMNVLEHCRDALSVLENLHHAVKPGGVLVFSERWYDTKWTRYQQSKVPFWDVMHPINVMRVVVETLLSRYTPLYRRNFYYEGDYPTDEGVYFIGVKHAMEGA